MKHSQPHLCDCGRLAVKRNSSGFVCQRCADFEKLNEEIARKVTVGFKQKLPRGNPNFYFTPKEEDCIPIAGIGESLLLLPF